MAYFDKYGVEFSDDKKTLVKCPTSFKGEYIIPNNVTDIGCWAFANCGLTSISIPHGVINIGGYAFCNCRDLISVCIPSSVVYIGDDAFEWCTNLTSISIPSGIKSIAVSTFANCTRLTRVNLPNGLTSIKTGAFFSCYQLKSINIPPSVLEIGKSAFSCCYQLKEILIPNSVASIGDFAFTHCGRLAHITFPDSIINIGEGVFLYCQSLQCPIYNAKLFAHLPISYSTVYSLPNGIKTIAGYAFAHCNNLTTVIIPDSITSIGNEAFQDCRSLKTIYVPKEKKACFAKMEGLKDIVDKIVERDNAELTILLNIAKAYEKGIVLQQSLPQALVTYIQAAEKGSAEAAYHLGEWYLEGKNVPVDLQKALSFFQQAAQSGFKDAVVQTERLSQSPNTNNVS